ncbi:MAG: FGGY-family carbohydrate kinase [Candidatus Sumerlaeota bacterium]|nr:FGGY-family carbohydrate kinase [Candidatus Sumerlaeota bacterium]
MAASLCGGAAWAWLADTVTLWLKELGAEPVARGRVFERLSELGMATKDELLVRPHFLSERHDPLLRGAIERIEANPLSLGPLARGLARGIIANLRDMLPAEVLAGRARVVASGNALRRSPLLRQMTEEVFGLPLQISDAVEEAATGAALLASAL